MIDVDLDYNKDDLDLLMSFLAYLADNDKIDFDPSYIEDFIGRAVK